MKVGSVANDGPELVGPITAWHSPAPALTKPIVILSGASGVIPILVSNHDAAMRSVAPTPAADRADEARAEVVRRRAPTEMIDGTVKPRVMTEGECVLRPGPRERLSGPNERGV